MNKNLIKHFFLNLGLALFIVIIAILLNIKILSPVLMFVSIVLIGRLFFIFMNTFLKKGREDYKKGFR